MIFYANPCSPEIRDLMKRGRLGCIDTPHQANLLDHAWDVIADNGCYSGRWRADHWLAWLRRRHDHYRFAVCPDFLDPYGAPSHDATLELWERWAPMLKRMGLVPAFVCQLGCTYETIPTDADVLFIGGGDTGFKLSTTAWEIVQKARTDCRWVHMGQVNSERRLTTARAMGCDSVDGTFLTFGPDVNLPRLLGWLDRADFAPMLWEAP